MKPNPTCLFQIELVRVKFKKMSEPTITSSIEVYPGWFSGRIFPKVQWEDQSIEKIIKAIFGSK